MRRRFIGLLPLVALGCGTSSAGPEPDPPTPPAAPTPLLIRGVDMGIRFQNVRVSRPGHSLAGVTVEVNGTALQPGTNEVFSGALPAALQPGSGITVAVRDGTLVSTGSTTVPPRPTLVAPDSGARVEPGTPVAVAWSSSENPDRFLVILSWVADGGGSTVRADLPGTARDVELPTTAVPADARNVTVSVLAYRDGSFQGAANADSRMNVRHESEPVPISWGTPPPLALE